MTENGLLALLQRSAGKVFDTDVAVEVVRVHDGDTCTVNVPGWPAVAGSGVLVRLWGWDAPELHDRRVTMQKLARQAKAAFAALLANGGVVARTVRRDKYFRLLCELSADNVPDVGKALADAGLVRPYQGEGPKPW